MPSDGKPLPASPAESAPLSRTAVFRAVELIGIFAASDLPAAPGKKAPNRHTMLEQIISQRLQIPLPQVEGTVRLLREGATIPFISRYLSLIHI